MTVAYAGTELEIFRHAQRWKNYCARLMRPFLGANVLEVGAGIGATTAALCDGSHERWVCLEPDANLAATIGPLPHCCRLIVGTTGTLETTTPFDSILYIDVLEHIDDDRAELRRAMDLLKPEGHLVVLAPAHQSLYGAFDRAIGHHRRYDRAKLDAVMPPELERVQSRYLDVAGLMLMVAARALRPALLPRMQHIALWDRLVPISRALDPLLGYRFGKSLLDIRRKRA